MDVILLAAGSGSRSGLNYPKQFHTIKGKPMIVYSLELFERSKGIKNVFVCCQKETKKEIEKIAENYNFNKVKAVIGGKTRQESVKKGLEYVVSEKVIIHEAARPFISDCLINKLVELSDKEVCIVPVIDIPFTVSSGNQYMDGMLDRDKLKNIQLPQICNTEILKDVHKKAYFDNVNATEDSMLFYKYGYKVKFIDGSDVNIKITTPLDFIIANNLMELGDKSE